MFTRYGEVLFQCTGTYSFNKDGSGVAWLNDAYPVRCGYVAYAVVYLDDGRVQATNEVKFSVYGRLSTIDRITWPRGMTWTADWWDTATKPPD